MSYHNQKPWRTTKDWKFPYSEPIEKNKKWIADRKKLFTENGHGWWIDLWNRIW